MLKTDDKIKVLELIALEFEAKTYADEYIGLCYVASRLRTTNNISNDEYLWFEELLKSVMIQNGYAYTIFHNDKIKINLDTISIGFFIWDQNDNQIRLDWLNTYIKELKDD